jgi:hypothetical protein
VGAFSRDTASTPKYILRNVGKKGGPSGDNMKPTEWIAIFLAVNNGWSFAAFLIAVTLSLYFRRKV